jgi:hypothetical protein
MFILAVRQLRAAAAVNRLHARAITDRPTLELLNETVRPSDARHFA